MRAFRGALPPFAPSVGLLAALALAGCGNSVLATRGETQVAPLQATELAQSDVNRMATLGMRDNLDSLLRMADTLYRRNPAEWRRAGAPSREAALAELRQAIDGATPWPQLQGKRDIAALSLALSPDFTGDRVAAFVAASADMLVTAHGGKTKLHLNDSLDAQHLRNAARNIEIAVWLRSNRRNAVGQALLLADPDLGLRVLLSALKPSGATGPDRRARQRRALYRHRRVMRHVPCAGGIAAPAAGCDGLRLSVLQALAQVDRVSAA
ncbi:MAG: hypothetical protein MUP33_11690 [Polaromonas sp.]|nr:hypothetical protein [Polaromonas sp.]